MGDIERKTETINLRLSPRMKALLRAAAEHEHRTLSNMIEVLVLDYCKSKGITAAQDGVLADRKKVKNVAAKKGE